MNDMIGAMKTSPFRLKGSELPPRQPCRARASVLLFLLVACAGVCAQEYPQVHSGEENAAAETRALAAREPLAAASPAQPAAEDTPRYRVVEAQPGRLSIVQVMSGVVIIGLAAYGGYGLWLRRKHARDQHVFPSASKYEASPEGSQTGTWPALSLKPDEIRVNPGQTAANRVSTRQAKVRERDAAVAQSIPRTSKTAAPQPVAQPPAPEVAQESPPVELNLLSLVEQDFAKPDSSKKSDSADQNKCNKIRDRYISVRFPRVMSNTAQLSDTTAAIRSARLYFEDGKGELALELLYLAIAQYPELKPLWLALIELLYLDRNAAALVEVCERFRTRHGDAAEWDEIVNLGQQLAPKSTLFGSTAPARPDNQSWPSLPNWIQAPTDTVSQVANAPLRMRLMVLGLDANAGSQTGGAAR
jgi:hypothetical protein